MATSGTPYVRNSSSCLSRYLQEIRKFDVLCPDEELRLARQWVEHQDRAAAEALIASHLGLVVKIASSFRGYGLPLAEMIAEGNVGMMQAIERFDPERGVRLSTYAMWWIRAAILEYILRSWSLVRLCTTPQHKRLFFKLRGIKTKLGAIEDGDLSPATVAKIAEELDVGCDDVVIMNRRLAGSDHSLNAPRAEEDAGEWQDWLVDPAPNQEVSLGSREEFEERLSLLHGAMADLSTRERHILTSRRLLETPLKLETLAIHYGVSRERIRQIEERAFLKIQRAVTSQGGALIPTPGPTAVEAPMLGATICRVDGGAGRPIPSPTHEALTLAI